MTRVLHRHRLGDALIPCATAQPAPAARPRAVDAPRPARRPGVSVEVLRELRATDTSWATPRRDPHRYDPNRLLPRSAMVRQVRVDQIPQTVEQTPVSQLCAAAGLVYAERHVAAQVQKAGA